MTGEGTTSGMPIAPVAHACRPLGLADCFGGRRPRARAKWRERTRWWRCEHQQLYRFVRCRGTPPGIGRAPVTRQDRSAHLANVAEARASEPDYSETGGSSGRYAGRSRVQGRRKRALSRSETGFEDSSGWSCQPPKVASGAKRQSLAGPEIREGRLRQGPDGLYVYARAAGLVNALHDEE
jgi:hypothetical protein